MLLGAITLTIVGGIWLFARPAASPDGPLPTAIVRTATPTPVPTAAPPTATPEPPAPGTIALGRHVQVVGTGASGLSIRSEAGTAAQRLGVANDGEDFVVAGGPQDADGYTWWFVRDEANPDREGWVAQDYLTPTE